MSTSSFFSDLQAREIIHQSTDPGLAEALERSLKAHKGKGMTLYCGFDPTSDSLHVGSLFPLMTLRRFQMAGHTPIAVVGGATGRIGDPSGKSQERQLLDDETLQHNLKGMQKVIERFLDFKGTNAARVMDNYDWFKGYGFIDFLRDIGKHFTVNMMIAKESVRARLEDRAHGISFTEFSYQLLQAFDFYHLHHKFQCTLQIGGSDQWGNITAGTELIRRTQAVEGRDETHVYGLTQPLVTKADGTKFGKTESGTIWLDAAKTSPYEFYQFFIQTPDTDVIRYLKFFSFRPVSEILALEAQMQAEPEKRAAQIALAHEITTLVHGEKELALVEQATKAFFGGEDLAQIPPKLLEDMLKGAPQISKSRADAVAGVSILDLMVEGGLFASRGVAKKDLAGGGVYLNNARLTDAGKLVGEADLLHGQFALIRKGKKNYLLVRFG